MPSIRKAQGMSAGLTTPLGVDCKARHDRTARHKRVLGFVGIASPVFLDGQKSGLQFAQRRFKAFGSNAGAQCGTTLFAIQNMAVLCH